MAGTADIASQSRTLRVERKFQTGEVQQRSLAGPLRTQQEIVRQLTPPALTASPIETGAMQGAVGVTGAGVQFLGLVVDALGAQLIVLALFGGETLPLFALLPALQQRP